ncbi:Uncharacterised protein [Mycobacterium tuberculosis]|nr:Uncharacterised protein [Mycobacterium tuberculosis]CNL80555.1 Uncharacterised protein [Mycobacterium tuberculosis]CNM04979.1 Uncharacterised protein [Mycobacterium tuberculosis]CNM13947.1 Uncharacterised protein [Mycobacterium tuberculosis]CNM17626.1 Uncharacterised protein [Mycobacterium tuberculosis]
MRARPDDAQRGPAIHPRARNLRRRRRAAGHVASGHPAFAVCACPHRAHRCDCRAGTSESQGRGDRRRSGRQGPGLDADTSQRRTSRAGHRQDALPGPRGGVRGCRGPVFGPRCMRVGRRRLRTAGSRRGCPHGAGPVGAGHPHRSGGKERQSHLRLGDRRRGGDRGGVRQGRRRCPAGDRLPAGAPGADGNLWRGGRSRSGHRKADAVDHQPGAARASHAIRAGGRVARTQDSGDLARHRRRLRQQGADLSRLCLCHCRVAAAGQAGQMDGGPQREPDVHRIRPRLHHGRRDCRQP